jgi:2-keto-4-pentenoate hydratase
MLADYDAGNPGTVFGEGVRFELGDAWRLQGAVTRLREARGEQVVGYKVGCVSPGNQKTMGVAQPVWGRLWNTEQYQDGVVLSKANYNNIAIEAEFGVTLARLVTPDMALEEVAASVDALYPLLELHDLVMRGEPPHGHELVANNCINCGVVRGAPIRDLHASRDTDLKLVYDGDVVDAWASLTWPGNILAALAWLARDLATQGLELSAGALVLTGAWGPPIPLATHTHVEVTSSTFGNVAATFSQ